MQHGLRMCPSAPDSLRQFLSDGDTNRQRAEVPPPGWAHSSRSGSKVREPCMCEPKGTGDPTIDSIPVTCAFRWVARR